MNEKSLEKNLANLERELVNLQTAHEVGLGAVGFYVYEGDFWTFTYSGDPTDYPIAVLMMTVLNGERTDPLLDVYISSIFEDNRVGFASTERYSATKFDVYISRPFYHQAVYMHYRVVSSSKLYVKPAQSYSEYVEWLDE